MAGLWFDRPPIRPPDLRPEDARVARAKRERIKFRLVQAAVLMAATLFADAMTTEGRVRRDIAAQAGGVLARLQREALRLDPSR
jgi:hypothetical protein